MYARCLIVGLFLLVPMRAAAEWQVKPFVGLTFGGDTTFIDLERAVDKEHFVVGGSGLWLGEIFGLEGDFSLVPGFFQSGDQVRVLGSRVTTLTGNLVLTVPRRVTGYSLRPYLVVGGGMLHARIDGRLGVLDVSSTLPAMDFGAGVTGFLSDRVGLSWEIRRFQSFGGEGESEGVSFGDEQLSFWRFNMAVALRY